MAMKIPSNMGMNIRTKQLKVDLDDTDNMAKALLPNMLSFKLEKTINEAINGDSLRTNEITLSGLHKRTVVTEGGTVNDRFVAQEVTILSIHKRTIRRSYSDYLPELQITVPMPVLTNFNLKSEAELIKPTDLFAFHNTNGNGITVWWRSDSKFPDNFKIYYSNTPFTESSLPSNPLVVSKESLRGVDANPLPLDSTRYYMVGVCKGDTTVLSDLYQYTHTEENTYGSSPRVIGEFYNGGYYIGNVELNNGEQYAVLVSKGEAESEQRHKDNTQLALPIADNGSYVDGKLNTENMVAEAGSEPMDFPAATYCVEYSDGTYNDWYLPAKNELDLFADHIDPNTTIIPEFMDGAIDQIHYMDGYDTRFIPGVRAVLVGYLSSTSDLSYDWWGDTIHKVWTRHFHIDLTNVYNKYDDDYYNPDLNFSKSFIADPISIFRVRPVRRELISQ